ncbi:terminase large subunit domain-containing protein [Desulfobacca acetoxidans]
MPSNPYINDLELALRPDLLLQLCGLTPDPWQQDFLVSRPEQALLLCSRQSGKSTSAAALALHEALFHPGALILLLSPSLRQSQELFRKAAGLYQRLPHAPAACRTSALRLEFDHGSRIISLPGQEETIRGFSEVRLLVIDEAALVPDELYYAVRPMLAVSRGRLIALSTPAGKRGWFYHCYTEGGDQWQRYTIPATQCPRISADFLAAEQRSLPAAWFRAEYFCEFGEAANQLFPAHLLQTAQCSQVSPLFAAITPSPPTGTFLIGLDLGQSQDYSALTIIHRSPALPDPPCHLRHLQRFPLRTPYPDIVRQVRELLQQPQIGPNPLLIVDKTGVGAPVVDMLTQAGMNPYAVTIHGGEAVSQNGRDLRLPQRDLIANLQVALQTGSLKLAPALPQLPLLIHELENFHLTISASGRERYAAGPDGPHDDLVFSLALALWGAKNLCADTGCDYTSVYRRRLHSPGAY